MLSRREMMHLSAASVVPLCVNLSWADEKTIAADTRLGKPKTLNDYFPFTPPKTLEEWTKRRQEVREQVLVANGLWPMPERTPLKPVIHGKIERDGYTIEKVFFASTPGHYVCGNLYRPTGEATQKRPAVLFAHGHFANGRFHDAGEAAGQAAIKRGEESDIDRARFLIQILPASLARMGFVVFQYDMIGYADSTAIPHIARSGVPHPEGFADVEGELRLQSLMGLQTWNSVRSLDFLCELPDVDVKKIGITGASGGGTQTFLLAAIDDRIAAAFPAVMVSTAMQGGCVCENCSYLRVRTGNIELAGVFAPKPQAMSGANDWTKEIMTKGFPELRQLYKLYGAEENVAAKAWVQFPHNYGQPSREFMYTWFKKHLQAGNGAVEEKPFKPVPIKELSVFDEKHPRPTDELGAMKFRDVMSQASDAQMAKLTPTDEKSLTEFRKVVGTALRVMVNSSVPSTVTVQGYSSEEKQNFTIHKAILGRKGEGDALPSMGLIPKGFSCSCAVLWLHPKGIASLLQNGVLTPEVKALHDKGYAVLGIDPLGVGALTPSNPFTTHKDYAGFTFGYNRSLVANQVHDVLTAIGNLLHNAQIKTIHVIGWAEMGPIAVLAKALAGDTVKKLAADVNQFRFEAIKNINDPMLLPGATKYGGLGAFLALCAPGEVLVHNHKGTSTGKLPQAAYAASGAKDKLTRVNEKMDAAKVIEWVVS